MAGHGAALREFLPDTGPGGRAEEFASSVELVLGYPATGVKLEGPRAVVAATDGNLIFVADMASHCVWRFCVGSDPEVVAGKRGVQGGGPVAWPGDGCLGTAAALEYPHDLALEKDYSTLYICELYCVRALDLTAEPLVLSTVYQSDYGLGGIALSLDNLSLIIAQHSRHLLVEVSLERKQAVTSERNTARVIAGNGEPGRLISDAPALQASLNNPTKLAALASGDIIFVDSGNRAIRLLQRATATLITLSGAVDAADGIALSPAGTVFISEGRSFQVLQFRPDRPGCEWNWGTCAGTCFSADVQDVLDELQASHRPATDTCLAWRGLPRGFVPTALHHVFARSALRMPLLRPQGLCWVPGFGLLICDARAGTVYLARALNSWSWFQRVILPRSLVEQGRAQLCHTVSSTKLPLWGALSILMRLPDEEFREVLSWWQES